MSLVNIVNMVVLDNPATFSSPFQFEITFECLQELEDDLEWKVIYVGSAEDTSLDQTLEEVLVGPIPVGVNKFVLQAEAPHYSSIPEDDLLGVTVVLVTCSYRDQEFARVGYYVNNDYGDEYDPQVGPPRPLDSTKVVRQILADKPRVTRFPIQWGNATSSSSPNKADKITPDEQGGGVDVDVIASGEGVGEEDGSEQDEEYQRELLEEEEPSGADDINIENELDG